MGCILSMFVCGLHCSFRNRLPLFLFIANPRIFSVLSSSVALLSLVFQLSLSFVSCSPLSKHIDEWKALVRVVVKTGERGESQIADKRWVCGVPLVAALFSLWFIFRCCSCICICTLRWLGTFPAEIPPPSTPSLPSQLRPWSSNSKKIPPSEFGVKYLRVDNIPLTAVAMATKVPVRAKQTPFSTSPWHFYPHLFSVHFRLPFASLPYPIWV